MSPQDDVGPNCESTVKTVLGADRGVISTTIDPGSRRVSIEYDDQKLSDAEATRILGQLSKAVQANYANCTLRLGGHACEGCAIKLERRAQRIPGIRRASATFIGGVMNVSFDRRMMDEPQLEEKLRSVGAKVQPITDADAVAPTGFASWFKGDRLEITFTGSTLVFLVSAWLATHFWGTVPRVGEVLYGLAYLTGGTFGVIGGLESLKEGVVDVDLLMVLAALGAAFIGAPFEGATLLFLFSLSNVLQAYAIDRTRSAITSLMKLRPTTALCRRDGGTQTVPIEEITVGEVLVVRPGESLALDGVVIEGSSTVDEAMLTGESMPVAKEVGSPVFGGTMNQSGSIDVRVSKLAKDSTIAKLIQLVEHAQGEKANTQLFLEKAEQVYALGVMCLTAGLILIPWLALGQAFHAVFYRAMTVMVVASPCALIISTPASILSAIGGAARRGILFKGGAHLERMSLIAAFAFDKTGTLTQGKPQVTDLFALPVDPPSAGEESFRSNELLILAASVEARSEHPLARAIVAAAGNRGLSLQDCTSFQATPGKGAAGIVAGRKIAVGSVSFFERLACSGLEEAETRLAELQDQGKTCVLVGEVSDSSGTASILGIIAVADVVRPEAAAMIARLRALGIRRIAMLTGDHQRVADAIARTLGLDEVHAQLLPEQKVKVVRELRSFGPVAMVGDGINDAPALAAADIGIAMGAGGTDVAMETADVVLMSDQLMNIAHALQISRRARFVVGQNLTFAMGVILVMVTATLIGHVPLTVGVVMHEGSTVLVCLNGLRLLLIPKS